MIKQTSNHASKTIMCKSLLSVSRAAAVCRICTPLHLAAWSVFPLAIMQSLVISSNVLKEGHKGCEEGVGYFMVNV